MAVTFLQVGDVVNHVAGAAYSKGDVIVMGATDSATIGIAMEDIASGATGPVARTGMFAGVAKVSAAVFKQGEDLHWDSSASAFDDNQHTPASGDVSGGSVTAGADGANTETTCTIILTGTSSLLTA